MPLPLGVYRADHVGSLLRPREILEARERLAASQIKQNNIDNDNNNKYIDTSSLRDLEDRWISSVVSKELACGLRSITDGEFRRAWFHLDFLRHLEGIEVEGALTSTHAGKQGMMPPRLIITGKLSHPQAIQVEDFEFLETQIAQNVRSAGAAGASTKVAIPSPTMCHFRGSRDTISSTAYPSIEPYFFDDLARVYQEELADLYAAGCRFVQLDDTNLAYLCDEGMRREAEARHGGDAHGIAKQYADLINAAISKRPADMVVGIHLCRGNHRSRWFAQGGYEPVAEVLFQRLHVDVYFLEYDDARSGDFSPLRHLPADKVVVLGVMSSKKAELDDKAAVIKRLHEAAAFCPRGLDQLCLSHQCGFSSTMEGNDLTEDEQWAKIRLEVEIAKEVWGEDISR